MISIERSEISNTIGQLLADLSDDQDDLDGDDLDCNIEDRTRLIADLGLTSVDFIDLFVAIEKAFGKTIGFHDLLMVDGKYIADLRVGQLTDFLATRLSSSSSSSASASTPAAANAPLATASAGGSGVDEADIRRFSRILPTPGPVADPPRKHRRALFVLSPPRSGSTLMQIVLAGHPALFAPPELHLLWFENLRQRHLFYSDESNRHLVNGAIRAMMALDGLGVDEATRFMQRCEDEDMRVAEFYGILQARLGGRLLVDKSPSYTYSMEVLSRCERYFEDPLYIYLVRHPGGMIRSFTDAKLERTMPFMVRHQNELSREQFAELAWLFCNRNIQEHLRGVPAQRQHQVHYEAFVTDPRAVAEGICGFLGIDFLPEMIEPYRDKDRRMADGVASASQMSGDLKFHLYNRIEPEAAERWRRYLSEDDLSATTWELAARLGYRRQG